MSLKLPENPISRPRALVRDQVADYLRDAIFGLALAPGTRLVEREICEATATSRATVREALRQLESEGIVQSVAGKGTVVAGLSMHTVQEMYEVRAQLEALASRLFIEQATEGDLNRLQAVLVELGAAVDAPQDMIQLKSEFYDVLFAGAGNSELEHISQGLRQRITLAQMNSLSVPGRSHKSFQELQGIVDAITNRDADLAVRLTVEHIQEASKTVAIFKANIA